MTTLPLSQNAFLSVFSPPDSSVAKSQLEISNDLDMVLIWMQELMRSSDPKLPSNRIKVALKNVCGTEDILLLRYIDSMRSDFKRRDVSIDGLDLRGTASTVAVLKRGYEFGVRYLRLDPVHQTLFERSLHAVLRTLFPEKTLLRIYSQLFSRDVASVTRILESIGLGEQIRNTVMRLAVGHVKTHVTETCSGEWDEPQLQELDRWIETELYPRINVFPSAGSKSVSWEINEAAGEYDFIAALKGIARDRLLDLRITESFDIVVDYPDSCPALEEMKLCLTASDQRASLVNSFIQACNKRLLHSAVNTTDIISFYIALIRGFLVIDPRGVLLDKVARPLRRYLKDRDDTVQKIVHGILDTENELAELAHELKRPTKEKYDDLDVNWCPDPIDALPDFKKGKVGDIIGALISLFDSSEVFVAECISLFAIELLGLTDYDVSEVLFRLELLKLRFGENEISALDVMVRDLVESKRVNAAVHSDGLIGSYYSLTVISHLYWPNIARETFKQPALVEQHFTRYRARFETLKQGRTLHPVPMLGTVVLELEFKGKLVEFTVDPLRASVVALFEKSSRLTLGDIMAELQLEKGYAVRAVNFWIKSGILYEPETEVYITLEGDEVSEGHKPSSGFSEDLNDELERDVLVMAKYLPFVTGMLTNLGASPVAKIHGFLKMLVPKDIGGYSATEKQLEMYLDHLVEEDKVEVVGGKYKLRK
ncbi:hypothetical protein BABINDRAFT_163617 [Babjeviella inositovora NRRL Y-12698]|uniref:Anaphase-promoting complex subunit 2 n=1 Tax=Babjeviella inositovora NRRL Y-12698 TaxID=984486 RepID=A0A1E3QI95_9ASCO|nr:uncharacterized protein BABINDRAFT_163617 [Babjeviella inositovora NRRL Y-12698]ODQ77360.1 hypothetical protein BABINDRAFT_163617 [Babjeviella inositovora NRRL Y-12698]